MEVFVSALKWRAGDESGKAIAEPCWWTHRCLCRNAAPELHFPACTQPLAWRSVTTLEPSFCVHFLPLYLLVFVWVVFFIISYLLVKSKLLKARQQSSWWQVGLSNLMGISSATSIRTSCWQHRPPPPTPCGRSPGTASASRTGPVSRAGVGSDLSPLAPPLHCAGSCSHRECARSLCCIWCYGRAADVSGLIPVTTAVVIKCERLLVLVEFSQVLKAVSCIRIIPKMPYMQLCCHCWVLKPFCLNTESYSYTILTKRNFFQLEKICFYSVIFSLLKKMLVAWRYNFESSLLPVVRGWEGLLWFLLLVKGANKAPKFVISQSIGKVMFTFSDAKGPYIFGFPFSLSFPDFGC